MAPLSLVHELARSDSFDEEWEKSRASSNRSMAIGLSVFGVIAGSILLLICLTIYHAKKQRKRLAAVKVQPYNLPIYTPVTGAVAYSSTPSGAIYNAVLNGPIYESTSQHLPETAGNTQSIVSVVYDSTPGGAVYKSLPNGAVSVSTPGNTAYPAENSQTTAVLSQMGGAPPPAYTESRGVEETLK